jgi:hypothetical protein
MRVVGGNASARLMMVPLTPAAVPGNVTRLQ